MKQTFETLKTFINYVRPLPTCDFHKGQSAAPRKVCFKPQCLSFPYLQNSNKTLPLFSHHILVPVKNKGTDVSSAEKTSFVKGLLLLPLSLQLPLKAPLNLSPLGRG